MTDLFVWLVYLGGALAFESEKRGFFTRLGWPIELGVAIYNWVRSKKP